jgi:ubiquinone/menaquinone biosynthesis C-methylase UbiE
MTRIHEQNINTPEWFDEVWKLDHIHHYDTVRLRAFLEGTLSTDRILDVGAGWFGTAQYAVEHNYPGRFHALDFSPEAKMRSLRSLGDRAHLLSYHTGDALNMPFPDEAFDRVCSAELIEHMEVPSDLIAEMARVCRVGGRIIVGTVNDKSEAAKKLEYPEHLFTFEPDELVSMLTVHCDRVRYYLVGDYHFVEGVKNDHLRP